MFNLKKFSSSVVFVLLVEIVNLTFSYPTYGHEAHLGGGLGDFGGGFHGFQATHTHALASNDHHGGVSIVGLGGSLNKGITFDLTKHGDPGYTGSFGGHFISSGGGHGGHGGHEGGGDDHAGLSAYSSGLSSYDVGSHQGGQGHDAGEISPVLYSGYKESEQHNFGLHPAALHAVSAGHSGGHSGGGFEGHQFNGAGFGGHFEPNEYH